MALTSTFVRSVLATAVVVLALAGGLVRGEIRNPLGEGFDYDLSALKKVEPQLLLYDERDPVPVSMQTPTGLTVDSRGAIVLVGGDRLVVLDRGGRELRSSQLAGVAGCVACDADGLLFVGLRDRVQVLPATGGEGAGAVWDGVGEDAFLTGIAVSDDRVFAADAGQRVVHTFAKDGTRGRDIGAAASRESPAHFVIPSPCFDVAPGPDETFWVVNPGRHSLENYRPDGTLIASWGKASMRHEGFCGCCNPTHLAVGKDGTFVTAEKGLVRVKLYGPLGDFRGVVAPPSSFTDATVGLDVAVDRDGNVLVLDPVRRQVRVFTQKARAR